MSTTVYTGNMPVSTAPAGRLGVKCHGEWAKAISTHVTKEHTKVTMPCNCIKVQGLVFTRHLCLSALRQDLELQMDSKKPQVMMKLNYVLNIGLKSKCKWEGLYDHLKLIWYSFWHVAFHFQFWNLNLHFIWFATSQWMRQFLIQSNG